MKIYIFQWIETETVSMVLASSVEDAENQLLAEAAANDFIVDLNDFFLVGTRDTFQAHFNREVFEDIGGFWSLESFDSKTTTMLPEIKYPNVVPSKKTNVSYLRLVK